MIPPRHRPPRRSRTPDWMWNAPPEVPEVSPAQTASFAPAAPVGTGLYGVDDTGQTWQYVPPLVVPLSQPGGPFLPTSGGTMQGPLNFTVTGNYDGATLDVPSVSNNTFYLDYSPPHPAVVRLGDRATIAASNNYNLVSDTGGPTYTWVSKIYDNGYFERDATLSAISDAGGCVIVGAGRASDWKNTGGFPQTYGLVGFGVADAPGSVGDGAYLESHLSDATSAVITCETMTINSAGVPATINPYVIGAAPYSCGFAAGIGGHHQLGTIFDGSVAIAVNALPGQNAAWTRGIVFGATGIAGTDGADSGLGVAISMARNHAILWDASAAVQSTMIWSTATGQAQRLTFSDTGVQIHRMSDNGTLADLDMTGQLTLGNGITTNGVSNMNGSVTVGYNTGSTGSLTLNGADTSYRGIYFNGNGTSRWVMVCDNVNNFDLNAYDTSGNYLSTPLSINRTTGLASFSAAGVGGAGGPTWTAGDSPPTSVQPPGSLYSNAGGTVGSHLYVSAGGGTWNAVAGV